MLGRSPFSSMSGGMFSYFSEDKYISALQNRIDAQELPWIVCKDDTESDIEEIIKKNVSAIICAPGLKYQFSTRGFDKKKVIYLETTSYVNNEVSPVIAKLKEILDER